MKRLFADLHLGLNVKDPASALRIINRAATLGYRLIAASFLPEICEDERVKLQSMCSEAEIDLASRVDLKPRTQWDLTHQLRRLRRRYEIIAVTCEDKEVARQAAKDHRVDLLNFPSLDYRRRFFDSAEAELASGSLAALEVDIRPLLVLEGPARVRLLSSLRREAALARDFHVPIVVSSGASNERLLRRPRELAALSYLFGLNEAQALETVSGNPVSIVERNRQKLSPDFVAPGIRIIKRGKDS